MFLESNKAEIDNNVSTGFYYSLSLVPLESI